MLGLWEHGDEQSGSITEDLFTCRIKQSLITKTPHSGIICMEVMKSCLLSCLTVLFHYYSNVSSATYLPLVHLIPTGRVYRHWHHLLWAARNERFLQVSATISMCFLFLEHCMFFLYNQILYKEIHFDKWHIRNSVSLLKTSCHSFHHSRWGSDNWIWVTKCLI